METRHFQRIPHAFTFDQSHLETDFAMDSLARLQGLHADLVAFTETRLANIDRLWQELEDSIQDFRHLLDKPTAESSDREAYNNGTNFFASWSFLN